MDPSVAYLKDVIHLDDDPSVTPFIREAISACFRLTSVDEWNYLRSIDNPSDEEMRGLSAISLRDSPLLEGS